jgi:hypothetical protein
MPCTRRSRGQVSTDVTGWIYLLHFHERLGTDEHYAQHYLGFTPDDPDNRAAKHRNGQGARITRALKERGIGFDVAAVWPGNQQIENELKLHSATRICPQCTPGARPPRIIQQVIKAEERRQVQEAHGTARLDPGTRRRPATVAERVTMSPYERGADIARWWIQGQVAAGRTAEQIAAAAPEYMGDVARARARRGNEVGAEIFRGWSAVITAELARIRDGQAKPV